ncbi:MAG: efflux RND transporter periplasmic adaptor subunit [Paracoccus sp. (in: a-proteobacteria)]|uniref:efflux RND transporter periplasmic adaptor subunit n=1 Tax=Paracoccus sp. TaxID=267 RepID=UPI0026DF7D0E|nr:efflux RND transporter periplasmic adaptor subunit [Paracoccus sp. (in: a-proteobacteria)]MDO5632135.1 efflux RND transporter periplasmic adaptor subunit [Paracoccus sp. (in: a-proteobacteria)]
MLAVMLAGPAVAFDLSSLPWMRGNAAESQAKPRPVVSEILADTDQRQRSVPGVISAHTEVNLAFQTLGRLISRSVDLGDHVAEGQELARLDPEDLTGDVRAAQASVDAAEVQLATQKATEQRTRELARRNVASRAQLEQAEQALAAAQAAADQARSELVRARDAEGFAQITAPFSGVISGVYENPGAIVTAGTPILRLSAEDGREAVVDLPEALAASLPRDSLFIAFQDSTPPLETRARIDRIEPMTDSATRTRRIHLSLENGDAFRLGALIRVRMGTASGEVLTLPDTAIVRRGNETLVWRISRPDADTATVHLTPVQTGPRLEGRVLVTGGLAAGDEIVTRGVYSLTEGQAVGPRVDP